MNRTNIEREYEHPTFDQVECKILEENGKYIQVNYWRKKDLLDVAIIENYDELNQESKKVEIDHPIRYCRDCSEVEKPNQSECPVCGDTMMIWLPEESNTDEIPKSAKLITEVN